MRTLFKAGIPLPQQIPPLFFRLKHSRELNFEGHWHSWIPSFCNSLRKCRIAKYFKAWIGLAARVYFPSEILVHGTFSITCLYFDHGQFIGTLLHFSQSLSHSGEFVQIYLFSGLQLESR